MRNRQCGRECLERARRYALEAPESLFNAVYVQILRYIDFFLTFRGAFDNVFESWLAKDRPIQYPEHTLTSWYVYSYLFKKCIRKYQENI
jgi:hypothetical protein